MPPDPSRLEKYQKIGKKNPSKKAVKLKAAKPKTKTPQKDYHKETHWREENRKTAAKTFPPNQQRKQLSHTKKTKVVKPKKAKTPKKK